MRKHWLLRVWDAAIRPIKAALWRKRCRRAVNLVREQAEKDSARQDKLLQASIERMKLAGGES